MTTRSRSRLGQVLRDHRRSMNLTQRAVSLRLHRKNDYVSTLEYAPRQMRTLRVIARCAISLGLDPVELAAEVMVEFMAAEGEDL